MATRSRIKQCIIPILCFSLLLFFYFLQVSMQRNYISNHVIEDDKDNSKKRNKNGNDDTDYQKSTSTTIIPHDYNATFFNPGWKCTSSPSQKKLIFVHVFKTAGSTFRQFFDEYGQSCNKGVTTIISCSQLSSSSLNSNDPNIPWEPGCELKHTITRSSDNENGHSEMIYTKDKKVTTKHLQTYSDIVIGHLPLGIHKYWIDPSTQKEIEEQYIAFFREPYVKFVSGRLFVNQNKHWTLKKAVKEISKTIKTYYKNGNYYNGYIKYLTTPEQKEYGKEEQISNGQWVHYINQNIIDMHVVVGIVESMSDSLELIQSLVDVDRERTEYFQSLIYPSHAGSLVANKSELSSSKIVSILKEDTKLWRMFEEIMKYEFKIYNFALKVHEVQIKELKRRHGDRYKLDNE